MELRAQASENAQKFLGKKLVELKDKVEKTEAALNDYRRERGMVVVVSEDKGKVTLERLTDLNKALTDASTERIGLEAQASLVREGKYDALPAVTNNPLIQNLKQEQSKTQAEYASLANQFTSDYPQVAQLRAKLDETNERLTQEMGRVAGSTQASYRASLTRENELRRELDREKTRVLALNDASLQDTILSREVDASRELYQNVLSRMNQMGVSSEVRASNVTIVDNAEQPTRPSSPQIGLTLGITGLVFTLLSIAFAFILERLDNTFSGPEEVERELQLATLGVVPDFKTARLSSYRPNGYRPRALPGRAEDEVQSSSKEIVSSRDPFSAASEAYRSIRTTILLSRAGKPPKIILVTSATEKEGKTVTAVNTAAAFAQTTGNVVLIDSDLRRPRAHEVLGLENRFGLTEALTGHRDLKEVIFETSINGLHCITAGSIPPNPSELLGSQTMRDILEELSGIFDFVILDSSPLMPVTDSVVLSTMVDGLVLVVGARTPKQWTKNVCARLRQVEANILGVVVNGMDAGKEASGYYSQTYQTYYSYNNEA
jgi:capsular exopolysaccharide synthesis family protein